MGCWAVGATGALLVRADADDPERNSINLRALGAHGWFDPPTIVQLHTLVRRADLWGFRACSSGEGQTQYFAVTAGKAFVAVVDLSREHMSPPAGGLVLDATACRCVALPPGRAAAVLALSDGTAFLRLMSVSDPDPTTDLSWDDPAFDIDWPVSPSISPTPTLSLEVLDRSDWSGSKVTTGRPDSTDQVDKQLAHARRRARDDQATIDALAHQNASLRIDVQRLELLLGGRAYRIGDSIMRPLRSIRRALRG